VALNLPGRYVEPGNASQLSQVFQMALNARRQREAQAQQEAQFARAREWELQDRDYAAQQQAAQHKAAFEAKQAEAKALADREAAGRRAKRTDFWRQKIASAPPEQQDSLLKYYSGLERHGMVDPLGVDVDPAADLVGGQMIDAGGREALRLRAQGDMVGRGEKLPEASGVSELSQKVTEAFGFPQGTPEHQREMQKLMAKQGGGTTINLNNGFAGPSKKTQADQEDALLAGQETLDVIDELRGLATNEAGQVDFSQFHGKVPRAKKWLLSELDDWDPGLVPEDSRPWLDKASAYRSVLDKYRSEEFKRLLGSAQTDTEIKNLINSVLSADMGSRQFSAATDKLEERTNRAMAVARKVLSKGIQVGTPEYRKAFREEEARTRGAATRPAGPLTDAQLEADIAQGNY
jgi:hypothetical protein